MDNLPKSVRNIVELVGLTPALALVSAYPGCGIKVPVGLRDDGVMCSRLIAIMGLEAAEKFIATYAGERMTIPRCVKALRDERDQRIISAYDAGRSVTSIAIASALTERQVRSILKRVPGKPVIGLAVPAVDDRQLRLF